MLTYGKGLDISEYNSPLKLFEYMAHKKSIISSDIPVLREVLDEENSILVEPDNINAWANALNQMAQPDLREKLSVKAHQDFLRYYTWQSRAKTILSLQHHKAGTIS